MATSETVKALQQAAEGLTYQSETDAPWKAFAWPQAQGEPTGAAVRQYGRHKANAPVEEQSVDEFFAPLVEERGARLWIHGHTHISFDYQVGDTRVVCNARGYPGEQGTSMNPALVIEV